MHRMRGVITRTSILHTTIHHPNASSYTHRSYLPFFLNRRYESTDTNSSSPESSDPNINDFIFSLPTTEEVTQFSASTLQTFHSTVSFDNTLFSWSTTIPLIALSIRMITFPLLYYHQHQQGRAALASKELPRIHAFVRATPGSLFQKYRTFRRLRRLAYLSAGTSGLKLFRWHMIAHIPLIITSSMGLRRIAELGSEEWKYTSLAWIESITQADPTYALPIITTGLWLWNVDPRSGGMVKMKKDENKKEEMTKSKSRNIIEKIQSQISDGLITSLQILSVFSLGMTMEMPSGIILFWMCNGMLTSLQRTLLSNDKMRRRIGLLTSEDIKNASGPQIVKSTTVVYEKIRKELEYVQREVLSVFAERRVDEKLRKEVNGMLERELWNGRLSVQLEAVIRTDDVDGKKYIAVVKKGSSR